MATKSKNTNTRKKTSNSKAKTNKKKSEDNKDRLIDEIIVFCLLAICILALLSNFGLGGMIGEFISSINFGIFGFLGYVAPIAVFLLILFAYINLKNKKSYLKMTFCILLWGIACTLIQLIVVPFNENQKLMEYYTYSSENKVGGGLIGGAILKLLCPIIGIYGTIVILILIGIISYLIIAERSIFSFLQTQGGKMKEDMGDRRARSRLKKEEERKLETERKRVQEEQQQEEQAIINERSKRKWKNISFDSTVDNSPKKRSTHESTAIPSLFDIQEFPEEKVVDQQAIVPPFVEEEIAVPVVPEKKVRKARKTKESIEDVKEEVSAIAVDIEKRNDSDGNYQFPPIDLLTKVSNKSGSGEAQLRETAVKLQQTLKSFGVNVQITDYSQGPAVTRYELQPESGVKVSRIVGLADDIKLNLAAADIRIEAPIPGKAAVGIEVPNKENSMVSLRSLLESSEFNKHDSNLAFAAGKDIGGKTVVTDIAKMPHLLIAGSTGSGKSVCINTIIMSILYKANPEDVKLIMIDPKVVELSVYNGIPHLLIPVVTDPKKAAGALHWAVAEMTKRYQLFAEYNVRDLKGYNEKVKNIEHIEDEEKPEKMPQIVVIVDELADLMMVAPGDVEEAICRLAQLARAAGIHLIIATQRPSVNVITGLIKANMPSRIAFAVSSGVDSRTIIDMNGAEKLLGKGDMLFYPQGLPKPARVQGAFVSDKEVQQVVEFLSDASGEVVYNKEIEQQVSSSASGVGTNSGAMDGSSAGELDAYFVDAGKFIIEKDKASIGMLQRSFKIGFNRAARIMDQLCDAGVVGEEEGTKPRKILMSMEEFQNYIEEYV